MLHNNVVILEIDKKEIIMPDLKCSVETCVHNKEFCCDRGHIDVIGGTEVNQKSETSCLTFKDYAMDNYTNSTKGATLSAEIDCDVTNCMFNLGNCCDAGYVEVQGSNACHSQDTQCASFVEKTYDGSVY